MPTRYKATIECNGSEFKSYIVSSDGALGVDRRCDVGRVRAAIQNMYWNELKVPIPDEAIHVERISDGFDSDIEIS